MSKTYNILWIDDEHDDDALLPFIVQAEEQGIILDGYGNFKDGFQNLENNLNHYDGVLLDALFFFDNNSETPNKKGLGASIGKLNELKNRKVFKPFVLSGQSSFTDEQNDILEANDLKCYNKKKPSDVKELLNDIKTEAETQIETQIKHENQILFNVLDEYDTEVRDTFMAILRGLKGLNDQFDDQLHFTQIRIILESLFRKANTIGLLHDVCVQKGNNQVNLTESSLFLSGLDTKYLNVSCDVTHFPKLISDSVKNIIYTTGAAAHTSNVDVTKNIDVQAYRKDINSPYLLYSLAFQLMDVLIWFDGYSKVNSDITTNQSHWKVIKRDIGVNKYEIEEITKIGRNGWGAVLINGGDQSVSIFKGDITSHSLNVGDKIKFTVDASSVAKNITKL